MIDKFFTIIFICSSINFDNLKSHLFFYLLGRLNTNEDSENRLGYDLYSSALADILSEPSLSMPISVGLYAKWGSGKSFLLNKLESKSQHQFSFVWFSYGILENVYEENLYIDSSI